MNESNILAKPEWQYYSKYSKEWIDAKITDRKDELIKYKYKIRITPKLAVGQREC